MVQPVVDTAHGKVGGRELASCVEFRGVPYAAPAVGTRRYLPPQPPDRWDGVLHVAGSADRPVAAPLALNIWTPSLGATGCPVMLWLSVPRAIDGRSFARDGVVVITLDYRLSSLYLDEAMGGVEGTGNLGLCDQIHALEWIADNIAGFGGDPGNVTIFGLSHGARFTTSLMATERARGLFHRAIPMSIPRRRVASAETQRDAARSFIAALGVTPGDWDALGEVAEREAQQAARQVGLGSAVMVDGAVLTGDPLAMIAAGSARGVDLMTGSTKDEATYTMFEGGPLGRADRTDPAAVRAEIERWFAPTGRSVDEVIDVYRQQRPEASEMELLCAISSDHFRLDSIRLAEAQLAHHERTYVYRFSWPSPYGDGRFGAYHSLDVPFAFDTLAGRHDVVGDPPPQHVADTYHGAFVRFARSGDPNGGGLPEWPTYNTSTRPVMDFGDPTRLLADPDAEERQLWDGARL